MQPFEEQKRLVLIFISPQFWGGFLFFRSMLWCNLFWSFVTT